jgi:hypothetical protein
MACGVGFQSGSARVIPATRSLHAYFEIRWEANALTQNLMRVETLARALISNGLADF